MNCDINHNHILAALIHGFLRYEIEYDDSDGDFLVLVKEFTEKLKPNLKWKTGAKI